MELKPIRNKREHQAALREIEALWNAKDGSAQSDRLEVLALLVERYEQEHFPIPDPDPIDFLHYVMESRGLARKDLEPFLGSRARVAEVLNRVRPLSLEMIRKLAEGLGIPAEVLVRRYALAA
ncbi:MAG: type II toxin-antitoxin system HigA family antitoxin [Burkholderiales bacterium]